VLPEYQRQGIGSLLLEWGKRRADELQAKVWITSTPQGVKAYEKNGWVVKGRYDIDLGKHGGEGLYSRAWMVRLPAESSLGTA
jgi:GNAT superfamily N-acetyltransferase